MMATGTNDTAATRRDAIVRVRARAYGRQRDLRNKLKTTVGAMKGDVRRAYAEWLGKQLVIERFMGWLRKADYPQECAPLVDWILNRTDGSLFAQYSPYLEQIAMRVALQVEGIIRDEGGDIARTLAREAKQVLA